MTRDAEHTPTGYEDAASVVVNQAPAPSSLAGGEVRARLENDLRTRNLYREEDGQTRLKVREDDLRAILAALSPEAPAREGVSGADMLTMTCFANNHDNPKAWAAWSRIRAALTPRHEAPASEDAS